MRTEYHATAYPGIIRVIASCQDSRNRQKPFFIFSSPSYSLRGLSSSPSSRMAANYLSLLMSSVNVSTSDDSDITNTHSTGQVDYLSHEWREEDVWHSWRRMTRQKNEIANGTRLENASWRTWWKQRNGLQTVNPETLNWSVSLHLFALFSFLISETPM